MKEPEGATIDIVYRPVWQVDSAVADLFYARPILRNASGNAISGAMPLVRLDTVEATAKRQVRYLQKAFAAHAQRLDAGDRLRLIVRLNSVAVATADAAKMVTDVFRTLSKDQRQHTIIEVSDFPKNLSVDNMDDITLVLMPFFDTLLARPDNEMTDYTLFANLNYAGVVLDLGDKALDLKLAGKVFKVFQERAERRRLATWVFGIAADSVAKVARLHKAQALSGSYMKADSDRLGPVLVSPQSFMI